MKTIRAKFSATSPQWTMTHPGAKLGFKLADGHPVLVTKEIVNIPDDIEAPVAMAAMNRATFVAPFAAPFVVEWEDLRIPGVIIRPPKEDVARFHLRLPQSLHVALIAAAETSGRSLNSEIVRACRKHIAGGD